MNTLTRSLALGAAGLLVLTACGGGDSRATSTDHARSTVTTAGPATPVTGAPAAARDIASIDVCALLSQTDAAAVARKHGLNGAQTAATVYTLTATRYVGPTGITPTAGCTFHIDGEGASGTVMIQVSSAEHFEIYASGDKVAGLGDEAYSDGATTVVRVAGVMLSAGEDSFTDSFVVDLYRAMIRHLR